MMFGHGDDLYTVGKNQVKYNFSSNVWYGASHTAFRRLFDEQFEQMVHYPEPDGGSLKKLLADRHGLKPSNLLVTNGSISAFYLLAQTWPEARSVILTPAFAEYEDACRLYHHRISYLDNKEELDNVELGGADFCWICNPNNPDGRFIEADTLLNKVKSCPRVTFIIDQVYMDFTFGESLQPELIPAYPNLVLIRSVSKLCNIPGLRIGYVMAAEEKIRTMSRYQIPWSVNSFALEASRYILEHPAEFVLPKEKWLKETAWLQHGLAQIDGIEVQPSSTTFFLIHLPGKSAALKSFLLHHYGVLVRDASNFRGLDENSIRLSTQSREANQLLLEGVRQWVETL